MTRRLFHEDPYLREFEASVAARASSGGRPAVILDRTAFYATSGGQPFDTGELGSAAVVDVLENEQGHIVHVLDREIGEGPVRGRIDWNRRFDHMQQHTGQHILSQAFVRTARAPTVSFHMGKETSTIDLELASPDASALEAAEDLACTIVFEDRPVHVLLAQPADLPSLGVRKASDREGEIRVIDVDGFDRSPCGGTHVRRSGEIGMIALVGAERYKGGVRVEFVCGGRALRMLRKEHAALREIARLYSASPDETPRLAAKHLEERSQLARDKGKLEERLLDFEARALAGAAVSRGGVKMVRERLDGRPLEPLKILAQRAIAHGADIVVLGSGSEPAHAVVARGSSIVGNCGAAVREASARHGGRGGGRPELAQAGGIAGEALETWLQAAEAHLLEGVRSQEPGVGGRPPEP